MPLNPITANDVRRTFPNWDEQASQPSLYLSIERGQFGTWFREHYEPIEDEL